MTEFKPAEQSFAQLSFKGFRHGVLDAYGLKEPAERKQANQAKVAELVRAAGSEIPSACERQPDGSWLIPMVSVSLQTHGKETGMIEGQNPYKFAARVLVLAQLAGMVPCFNCKSGKDRTGMVDVEVKSLLQSINENIQSHGAAALSAAAVANKPGSPSIVPSYATERTSGQKAVFKDLHLNGGSQQVSLATTGLMGNKSDSGYLRKNLDRDRATLQLIAGFARNADGNKG